MYYYYVVWFGEAAASTTFVAGDKRSISHYLFCGVTAAVAPNRSLGAGILRLLCRLVLRCQHGTQFHFIAVLFIVGKKASKFKFTLPFQRSYCRRCATRCRLASLFVSVVKLLTYSFKLVNVRIIAE